MEIKSNGKSVRAQLVDILTHALPKAQETQVYNHLHHVHSTKADKGKVIRFVWNKREFRVTANLKVAEFAFGFGVRGPHNLITNEMTAELETKLRQAYSYIHEARVPVRLQDVAPVFA